MACFLNNVFKPNKNSNALYAAYYPIFESLSTKLAEEFEAISLLQQKPGNVKN